MSAVLSQDEIAYLFFNFDKKIVNEHEKQKFNNQHYNSVSSSVARLFLETIGNQMMLLMLPSEKKSTIKTTNQAKKIINDIDLTYDNTVQYNTSDMSTNDFKSILDTTSEIYLTAHNRTTLKDDLMDYSNSEDIISNSFFKNDYAKDNSITTIKTFSINKPKNYNKEYYGVSKSMVYGYTYPSSGVGANIEHFINGTSYKKYTKTGFRSGDYDSAYAYVKSKISTFHNHVHSLNKVSLINLIEPPKDNRIETDCCIDVELYPDKYKLKV